jgi:hypothetical protein
MQVRLILTLMGRDVTCACAQILVKNSSTSVPSLPYLETKYPGFNLSSSHFYFATLSVLDKKYKMSARTFWNIRSSSLLFS